MVICNVIQHYLTNYITANDEWNYVLSTINIYWCIIILRDVQIQRKCSRMLQALPSALRYPYAGWSLHKDTTPPQLNHTITPTHIEPEQYNTWNKSTLGRTHLKIDVLTFEKCWTLNSEITKQKTSDIKLVYLYSTIKCLDVPSNMSWKHSSTAALDEAPLHSEQKAVRHFGKIVKIRRVGISVKRAYGQK